MLNFIGEMTRPTAIMAYSMTDKMEWTLIFAVEFGRRFGLTLKQAFNYLSRFGGIKFVDEHCFLLPRFNGIDWRQGQL